MKKIEQGDLTMSMVNRIFLVFAAAFSLSLANTEPSVAALDALDNAMFGGGNTGATYKDAGTLIVEKNTNSKQTFHSGIGYHNFKRVTTPTPDGVIRTSWSFNASNLWGANNHGQTRSVHINDGGSGFTLYYSGRRGGVKIEGGPCGYIGSIPEDSYVHICKGWVHVRGEWEGTFNNKLVFYWNFYAKKRDMSYMYDNE